MKRTTIFWQRHRSSKRLLMRIIEDWLFPHLLCKVFKNANSRIFMQDNKGGQVSVAAKAASHCSMSSRMLFRKTKVQFRAEQPCIVSLAATDGKRNVQHHFSPAWRFCQNYERDSCVELEVSWISENLFFFSCSLKGRWLVLSFQCFFFSHFQNRISPAELDIWTLGVERLPFLDRHGGYDLGEDLSTPEISTKRQKKQK